MADVTAVNRNGSETFLDSGVNTLFINGKPTFINGPRSLPRNPHNCTILDTSGSDNFILVDETMAKGL